MATYVVQGIMLTGAAPTDGSEPLAPAVQPLMWPRGQDGTVVVAIVDPLGAPVNIAGAALKLALRARAADAPLLEVVGSITDAANGRASFTIAAAGTASLAVDIYAYDVWISLSGARSQVVPTSNFSIQAAALPPSDGP